MPTIVQIRGQQVIERHLEVEAICYKLLTRNSTVKRNPEIARELKRIRNLVIGANWHVVQEVFTGDEPNESKAA